MVVCFYSGHYRLSSLYIALKKFCFDIVLLTLFPKKRKLSVALCNKIGFKYILQQPMKCARPKPIT